MSEAVTKRYARALFEIADEHGKIEEIDEDLQAVLQAFQDEGAGKLFMHPRLDAEEKKKIIDAFASKVTSEVSNFLKVLVDRHREEELAGIIKQYEAMANEARGIIDAVVTTAMPLTDNEKKKLADQFGEALNKQIRIQERIDPEIIGGMMIRIGNRVYDGTVAGKLSRFKQSLTQVR
ncbi:MAG TPA: F0F1 ATP synthase subunit delta [Bacillales bacterium]|nr:F0F1 ATP synthase subunit delta [Bacillales bacterium]